MSEAGGSRDDRVADWYQDLVPEARETNREEDDPEILDLGLITYGSLLHPEEIRTLFSHDELSVEPVKVSGYARRFSKSVAEHLRDVKGKKSGVLNVHSEPGEWFNGLLIGPLTRMGLRKYAFREREYGIDSVSFDRIDFYANDESILDRLDTVHTCLLDTDESDPEAYEPAPDYLELCLEGAQEWGEDFLEEFKQTTLVGEEPLAQYLEGF